jgi:hypothetical protein
MKPSKSALKTWSKKHRDDFTYGLTVYGSRVVHFWYETPREIIESSSTVEEFLAGALNHKVTQYLGKDVLDEIIVFLRRKFVA